MTLTTLRDRLRHETASDNAAAACALTATGCLGLPDPRAFLAIQAGSLLARRPATGVDDPETAMALSLYRRIRQALHRDLGTLPDGVRCPRAMPVMPTGFAYVVLGATMGISVIAPRWPGRTRFLDVMTGLRAEWAALSMRLDGTPATGRHADHAVAAARAVFAAVLAASGPAAGTGRETGTGTGSAKASDGTPADA